MSHKVSGKGFKSVVLAGLVMVAVLLTGCEDKSVGKVVDSFKKNPICVVTDPSKPSPFQCK